MRPNHHRTWLSLLVAFFTLLLPAVALAETVNCPSSGACPGTPADDVIYGTNNFNNIEAGSGSDRPVWGYSTGDEIHGAYGYDTLWGGDGDDTMYGGENGTTSWDRLVGGNGNDTLNDTWAPSSNVEFDAACGEGHYDYIYIADLGNRSGVIEADQYNVGADGAYVSKDSWDESVSASTCNG
jgi:Ca2+-binding RTX toxin-like protein